MVLSVLLPLIWGVSVYLSTKLRLSFCPPGTSMSHRPHSPFSGSFRQRYFIRINSRIAHRFVLSVIRRRLTTDQNASTDRRIPLLRHERNDFHQIPGHTQKARQLTPTIDEWHLVASKTMERRFHLTPHALQQSKLPLPLHQNEL